jgi:glutamate racemase
VDVIAPAAEAAARMARTGRIGVIATQATIESASYEKALKRIQPRWMCHGPL